MKENKPQNKVRVRVTMSTEELLKRELGTTILKSTGIGGGGCISEGTAYETDFGIVFIKVNSKTDAFQMFNGEYHGLNALHLTSTVPVPKPIKVLENPKGGALLVMEYLDFKGLRQHEGKLGELMARLHLHNAHQKATLQKSKRTVQCGISKRETEDEEGGEQQSSYVSQFGFPVTTCCGYLPQDNAWMGSWVDFFARKIDLNIKRAQEKYGDRQAGEAWSSLLPHLPKLFNSLTIEPALLHGDLWAGNAGETDQGPVVLDPASFYGHAEFDLAISTMFGGFGKKYFSFYHSLIPKEEGFEARQDLYCMFHYLNHWNHFGGGYKSSTIHLLKKLLKTVS